MANHIGRTMAPFTEIHLPTKTSRDTFIQVRARNRANLVSGAQAVIEREVSKGETVTWGSDTAPLHPSAATTAATTLLGAYHVVTVRIRRGV